MSAGWDRPWLAYICAVQGHIVYGFSTGTNAESIVWASHCQRCAQNDARTAIASLERLGT